MSPFHAKCGRLMRVVIVQGKNGVGRALVCDHCGVREWMPIKPHVLETPITTLAEFEKKLSGVVQLRGGKSENKSSIEPGQKILQNAPDG
jgi:hypothetical protein